MSGCLGGYTGSYIFSQTIFTYRTKIRFRLIGWVVVASEITLVSMNIDPLSCLPLYFFSAMLTFIGMDLMKEWLWDVRSKLLTSEYQVLLATFTCIVLAGINQGMVIGVVLSIIDFVIGYSSTTETLKVNKRSLTMRHPKQQKLLKKAHSSYITTIEMRGRLFFGTGMSLLEEICEILELDSSIENDGKDVDKMGEETTIEKSSSSIENKAFETTNIISKMKGYEPISSSNEEDVLSDPESHLSDVKLDSDVEESKSDKMRNVSLNSTSFDIQDEFSNDPSYLVLDFENVTGMDASGFSYIYPP